MTKVLFVCTGNIFRSMSAEKFLKDYLSKNHIQGIKVSSAGIGLVKGSVHEYVIDRLKHYGIKLNHKTTKLTLELIKENDLILARNKNHQEYIKDKFNLDVPLFNEIVYHKKEGILDADEMYPEFKTQPLEGEKLKKYIGYVLDYIHDSIPKLVENIKLMN